MRNDQRGLHGGGGLEHDGLVRGKKVQRLMWATAYGFPWLECEI